MRSLRFCLHGGHPVTACAAVAAVLTLAAPAWPVELLVTNRTTHQVLRYDANSGAPMDTGEGAGAGIFIGSTVPGGHGGLQFPYDLKLGADGNVYVISQGTNSVKVYDGTTGHYLKDFVTSGSGGLATPWAMTWGPDGNLYVTSNGNNQVMRYQGLGGASPGAFMDVFVSAGSGGLAAPRGIMFGGDQWTGPGKPAGTAQDGYPDLYVASFGNSPGRVLRYNGQNGQFVDVYATAAGGQTVNSMIYEQGYRRNTPLYNQLSMGNLLVAYESGVLNIFSGSLAENDATFETDFGPFFTGGTTRGTMMWGARRPNDTDEEKRQSLYIVEYFNHRIVNVGANEANLGALLTTAGSTDRLVSLMLKCGRNPPTLIREVRDNLGLQGTLHTLRLRGDNLSALTAVSLKRMRDSGSSLANDGTAVIAGANLRMDDTDLLVDFDLTGAEGGRYSVEPTDSCANAMRFPDAVLVYLPELANGGFEEGYKTDRENQNVCQNPGGAGNKSRPKHWDAMKGGNFDVGSENQFSIHRDGNIWQPCGQGGVGPLGMTGQHYGSIVNNFTNNDWNGMYQSIAAPHVEGQTSTRDYTIYIDAHIASFEFLSSGIIRLMDGDNYGGRVIAETVLPSTQGIDPDALVFTPEFKATVPAGTVYQSNPPVLTIAFISQSVPGDFCPASACGADLSLKAFHLDNVRTQLVPCAHSPWADADDDGDIDQNDFGAFQACFTGPSGGATAACRCFDRGLDGRIDDEDLTLFQNCATGPSLPGASAEECQ